MADEITSAEIETLLQQDAQVRSDEPIATVNPSPMRPYVFPIVLGGLLVAIGAIAQLLLG